jgi:hypothetical protein
MLSILMLIVIMLYVIALCHNAVYHCKKCHLSSVPYFLMLCRVQFVLIIIMPNITIRMIIRMCHNAECHCAVCQYAKGCGTFEMDTLIQMNFLQKFVRSSF